MLERLRRAATSSASAATQWSFLNVVLATIVGVITARVLGVSARGTLAILLSTGGLTILVGTLGTNMAIRRRLPQGQTTVGTYLRVSAVLFVIYVAVLPAVIAFVAAFVDPAFADWRVGLAFVLYGAGAFWSLQSFDLLNAIGKVPMATATNAFGTAVCLAGVAFVAVFHGGLVSIALCYAVSMAAQIALAIVLFRRSARDLPTQGEPGGRLVRDGALLMGLGLGQTITYQSAPVLLGALSTPQQVGLFSVAVSPASILRLPATAVGQVLLHGVAANTVPPRQVWWRLVQIQALLVPIAIIGWVLAEPATLLLFGGEFRGAIDIMRVLLIAELALSPFMILSRVLVGHGATWQTSIPGAAGAITLIGLGLIWIPAHGTMGAAWASVIAYAVMSAVCALQFSGRTRRQPLEPAKEPPSV